MRQGKSGEGVERPEIRLSRFSATYVGARITELREAIGWKRGRLARELGVNWNSLKNLETGAAAPSLGMLLALVRVFDLVSIDELLGEGRLGTQVLLEIEERARADAQPG